jgi:hypothetical protein
MLVMLITELHSLLLHEAQMRIGVLPTGLAHCVSLIHSDIISCV